MMKFNFALIVFSFLLFSCSGTAVKQTNNPDFEQTNPKSILIIPPLNLSKDVNAPYIYLSTVSKIVAERGYYVYPVAVIDNYFKDNGLPTTGEMNAVKVSKLVEVLNPDAILYVTINGWGQKFEVVQSRAVVDVHLNLIDSQTSQTIWQNKAYAQNVSGVHSDNFWHIILGAMFGQIINDSDSNTRTLSYQANRSAFNSHSRGLPKGPYFPKEDQ